MTATLLMSPPSSTGNPSSASVTIASNRSGAMSIMGQLSDGAPDASPSAAEADASVSLLSVPGMEPLIRRELATVVGAGLVLAPALRLEGDSGVAGGDDERRVLARQVTAVSKRLPTRGAVRVHDVRRLAHATTVGARKGG